MSLNINNLCRLFNSGHSSFICKDKVGKTNNRVLLLEEIFRLRPIENFPQPVVCAKLDFHCQSSSKTFAVFIFFRQGRLFMRVAKP